MRKKILSFKNKISESVGRGICHDGVTFYIDFDLGVL